MTRVCRFWSLILLSLIWLGCAAAPRIQPHTPVFDSHPIAAVQARDPVALADDLYAYTEPGELPRLLDADDPDGSTLPLEHTDVDAIVHGHFARVRVSQRFHNDREHPIEVVYNFPLPENAAVDDMRMVIGERVIQSQVQRRETARRTYEQARDEGYTAALLEQQRPNLFTQSVANVAPGETIEVELAYLQTLSHDGGVHEFVFPMVIGPRFVPADHPADDAARIKSPIVGEGQRSGNDVSLTISVDAGATIERYAAATHRITASATKQGFTARLSDAETIPNRDFVLRWQSGANHSRATMFMSKPDAANDGHFALLIEPPAVDLDAVVGRREMIFVVDRSGSMSGQPLALAKQTLREALTRLRPVDTFDVIGFETGTERLFGTPRPANEANLVLAERFIDGMEAGGGTMLADAVEAALAPRLTPDTHRYVFFLTDGFIANEAQIFAGARELIRRAERAGGRARVFALGIGSAPNRWLIAGLARAGEGVPLYVGNREDPLDAVNTYYRYVDHRVLEDVAVDWAGLDVEEVYPDRKLQLFASHTLVVLGRYHGAARSDLEITATVPGQRKPITIPITTTIVSAGDSMISTLWARAKIAELDARSWDGVLDPDEHREEVTEIGLEHHLVTAYTSLVAVDRGRKLDADYERIVQPQELAEDVDGTMSGAYGRDFTAVVELVPTANGDAAGISLAGTTGAESKYSVAGANYGMPELGERSVTLERQIAHEWPVDTSLPIQLDGPTSWPAQAKLRVLAVDANEDASTRAIKRALRADGHKLAACYDQHVASPGDLRLRLRLRFDEQGRLVSIDPIMGSLGTADGDACIEAVLRHGPWRDVSTTTTVVEVELRLWQ